MQPQATWRTREMRKGMRVRTFLKKGSDTSKNFYTWGMGLWFVRIFGGM